MAMNEKTDDLVLCMIIENDSQQVQKKKMMSFTDDIKFKIPHVTLLSATQELRMMCTINKELFHMFTKHMGIGNLDIFSHITNDDKGIYDIIKIDKSV